MVLLLVGCHSPYYINIMLESKFSNANIYKIQDRDNDYIIDSLGTVYYVNLMGDGIYIKQKLFTYQK